MIEVALAKAHEGALEVDFRVGDAVELDFPDETYDLVVARHVLWNLPEPERGIAEWMRVLRPGGRLLLVEGKWADSEELSETRLAARVRARVLDLVARAVRRGSYRKYRRVEAQLPFAGGPAADRLVTFLEANSVQDVRTEPLMNPTLWGESPQFPRFLVEGTRPLQDVSTG
jgi:ubiquinone/menaquinone biosynthesis C-methylase UbiE